MTKERHSAATGPRTKQPAGKQAAGKQATAGKSPVKVQEKTHAQARRTDPQRVVTSTVPKQSEKPPKTPTTRLTGRALSLVALLVGVAVAIAAFSVNRINASDPEAVAPLILDENEIHWPFFRASHDLADTILADPAVLNEAAAALPNPDDAISLRVDPSSDLSVLQLVATAKTSEAAEELAAFGAAVLMQHSQADRRHGLSVDLAPLESAIAKLEEQQITREAELSAATEESAQIRLRSDLHAVSDQLNARRSEQQELQSEIASTGSAYIFLQPAQIHSPSRQSLLASVAAGVGAAVLTLLMLSFITAQPRDD